MNLPAAMLLALGLDAAIGWPDALYRRIGHPVTWCGALITALETRLNQGSESRRRLAGLATTLLVILLTAALAALLQHHAVLWLTAILAWPLIAARSLHQHVAAVAKPLTQ
ncbi:MAG: cobalamin biosynthesis protein, partial [Rhodospirillales bacterium]|nr:cobalamin biosynthesis protein [Rhodospirillales bacterium]